MMEIRPFRLLNRPGDVFLASLEVLPGQNRASGSHVGEHMNILKRRE